MAVEHQTTHIPEGPTLVSSCGEIGEGPILVPSTFHRFSAFFRDLPNWNSPP